VADWPYNTKAWRKLRTYKLSLNPLCQYCLPSRLTAATVVDHVEPISKGGAVFDLENLKSSCVPCHSRKTARGPEAGAARTQKPSKGCGLDGLPTDEKHPWNAEKIAQS
jgi:5-methylcytosine-specific restriction protein A